MERLKSNFFWKYSFLPDNEFFNTDTNHSFIRGKNLVRIFYICLFYFAFIELGTLRRTLAQTPVDLLWPVSWIDNFPYQDATQFVYMFFLIASLIVCIFSERLFFRLLALIGFLFYAGLINSFGKINHGFHLWFPALLCFVFLPGKTNEHYRSNTLLIIASTIFLILMTYSLSGFWKLVAGIEQLRLGQESIFSLNSLSNHIARRLMETNDMSLMSEFLIDHSYIGFILFLGAAYLELFSLIVFFRPKLHRYWGGGLMAMHLGIGLSMSINFTHSSLILGLFLVASPFHTPEKSLIKILRELPLFGGMFWVFQTFLRPRERQKLILFYDGECGFCNSFVQFLLKHKTKGALYFAPIGGQKFNELFGTSHVFSHFDSLILYNPEDESLLHSKAALSALYQCTTAARFLSLLLVLPHEISDQFYKLVALIRKRLPSKRCNILLEEERACFLN